MFLSYAEGCDAVSSGGMLADDVPDHPEGSEPPRGIRPATQDIPLQSQKRTWHDGIQSRQPLAPAQSDVRRRQQRSEREQQQSPDHGACVRALVLASVVGRAGRVPQSAQIGPTATPEHAAPLTGSVIWVPCGQQLGSSA